MTIEDPDYHFIVHEVFAASLRVTGCGMGYDWPHEWWLTKINRNAEVRHTSCLECVAFAMRNADVQDRGPAGRVPRIPKRS